jgi:hypothetical protein
MTRNMGSADRMIRVAQALVAWCPTYFPLGLSTRGRSSEGATSGGTGD